MYSVMSDDRRERCGHDEHYEGCLSCDAHSTRYELEEAIERAEKIEAVIKGCTNGLAQSGLSKDDRASYQAKVERSTKQLGSWKERVQDLREDADSKKKDMETLYAEGVDPSLLPATFERHADERAEERRRIWRSRAPTEADAEFTEFQRETPNHPGTFKGSDLTKIEATPDHLVNDGVGLQVFLNTGKTTNEDGKVIHQQLPTQAIGSQTEKAVMSYGAAIGICHDKCAINESVEPATERELRVLSDSHQQTEPLLSEEQQWTMLLNSKSMSSTGLLARQYAKLVAEKEQAAAEAKKQEEEKKGKKTELTGEPSGIEEEASVEDPAASSRLWPAVEGLDWAGFTNWVKRCKDMDPNFDRVIDEWAEQRRERRASIIKKLEEWNPPADFDDGSASHPNPRDYYRHDKSLAERDLEKLGIKYTVTKGDGYLQYNTQ